MKPMLTRERMRELKNADDTFAYLTNKYGSSRSQREPTAKEKSLARKAASTLHDARLALLELIGDVPTREGNRRTYLRSKKLPRRNVVLFLMSVGVLHGDRYNAKGISSATRAYSRMLQRGEIAHPLSDLHQFAMDAFYLTDSPKNKFIDDLEYYFCPNFDAEIKRIIGSVKKKSNRQ